MAGKTQRETSWTFAYFIFFFVHFFKKHENVHAVSSLFNVFALFLKKYLLENNFNYILVGLGGGVLFLHDAVL